ncbi:DNA adenine methylase [Halolamina salifodinae]|uniref:site-specific DNA-methyltransferase (adenine-specific) n=1 Tax=Halolamina salifodinae TaxID=1202767 RepID=A0A8T4GXZ1_9EURY|nr:DNA adenine methylase [Halolamina salifodinae]MBP1986983.1 DNA adenine methylase [Halolamina salifodinae]
MSQTTLVPYIGGKTRLADWIISQFPEHRIYCEPFGGGASVLLNKQRSYSEVYNDGYSHIVHFFEIVKTRPDELVEAIQLTPYSRELYQEYQQELINGEYPDDGVERAARFFLVATASMQADLTSLNGFKASRSGNRARTWEKKKDHVYDVAERLRGVILENRDYQAVIEKYDTDETLYYLDPPYARGDDYYNHDGEFDHDRLLNTLQDIDGYFLLSYGNEIPFDLPDGWYVISEESVVQDTNSTEADEVLISNFDPTEVESWTGPSDRIDFDWDSSQ